MSTSFRIHAHVAAPPDRVWAALTEPAEMREWLAEHAEVSLADGRYEFWGRDTLASEAGAQRLVDADPPRRLRLEWDGEVDIVLEPEDGTALTVTLSDSEDWEGDEAGRRDFWFRATAALLEHAEDRATAPRYDFSVRGRREARAEIDIEAPVERVFASLMKPEELDRWLDAGGAEVDPRVGGTYDWGMDHGPMKILDLDPPRRLAYSWSNEGQADTVVSWELEGSEGRTHLTVVHSGFAEGRPGDGYAIGWLGLLIELKRMHELGGAWRKLRTSEVTPA
jgi:uncharacterized protein YndB with AHSA1/START domain